MSPAGRAAAALVVAAAVGAGAWWWSQRGPEPVHYTVAKGDTLWAIAKAHGVSVDDLRTWNDLPGDRIEVGQQLDVWVEGGPEEAAAAVATSRSRPRTSAAARSAGGATPEATPEAASWSMPPERPCLAGPDPDAVDADGDEAAFAASVGLQRGQVKASMDAFLPTLSRCLRGDEPAVGTLELEITVACTGRVQAVQVLHAGALSEPLVTCVRDGLGYAAFPPHDMPGGFTFQYPMRFSR